MEKQSLGLGGLLGLRAEGQFVLGAGFFNEVHVVAEDVVVKVAKPYGPLQQPLSWLRRNRREHEHSTRYLRVPATYHVRMNRRGDRPVSVLLQARLSGRLLSQAPDEDLYLPPLRMELVQTVRALERCRRQSGWLPDVIGGPPRWGMHDLRRSNNLFVTDDGEIWLIDPGALFLWFSRRNPVGMLYTSLLLWSGRRMLRKRSD
ncbi:MAG: hypothetical protein M3506_01420 [Chloroflexota bacterium]|nr:hypothetical protein [Chloroflexota bacterium]